MREATTRQIVLTHADEKGPGNYLAVHPGSHLSVRPVQPFRPRRPHWWSRRRPLVPAYVALYVDGIPTFTGGIVSLRGFGDDYVEVDLRA